MSRALIGSWSRSGPKRRRGHRIPTEAGNEDRIRAFAGRGVDHHDAWPSAAKLRHASNDQNTGTKSCRTRSGVRPFKEAFLGERSNEAGTWAGHWVERLLPNFNEQIRNRKRAILNHEFIVTAGNSSEDTVDD
jgi:hypothetical protein